MTPHSYIFKLMSIKGAHINDDKNDAKNKLFGRLQALGLKQLDVSAIRMSVVNPKGTP